MKKDYFGGNIKDPKNLFVGLCVFAVIMFVCGVVLLYVLLLYGAYYQFPELWVLIILCVVSFSLAFGYIPTAIYFAKNRKKYPRIATLLIQKNEFKD